jgi:hypothetical protein
MSKRATVVADLPQGSEAPGEVTVSKTIARSVGTSQAWERLRQRAAEFRKCWVALGADDVVASARTLDELLEKIRDLPYRPLVHFVDDGPREPEPADPEEPEAILARFRLLLGESRTLEARALAVRSAERFPDDEGIRRAVRVFEGRSWIPKSYKKFPDPTRALARLKERVPEFRGRWVALGEDDVLVASKSLDELLEKVQESNLSVSLVHFVE